MKQAFALIALLGIISLSLPAYAEDKKPASTAEIPADAIGKECEVTLYGSGTVSRQTYIGKVVRFDQDKVVLDDVTRTTVVMSRVPVLGRLPYFGKRFRNTGVGIEKVSGQQSLERRKVKSLVFTKPGVATATAPLRAN